MVVLSGHQPNYWPYPGLIGKIMRSDKFIYVTKVQLEKKSWQMRNRIRTKDGWTFLSVPVLSKGKFDQRICDTEINNETDWQNRSLKSIRLLYGKAPYFKDYFPFVEDIYSKKWDLLMDLDINIMNFILNELDCKTEVYYDTDFQFSGKKTQMLVDMCKKLNCDTYLSNLGSSSYVKIKEFTDNGLNHRYIDYVGKNYRQQFSGFEEGLSILDMLMNCGREMTKELIMDDSIYRFSSINAELND